MAFKDVWNNHFYGKPGKLDFTVQDLPATRIQLFKEVLKVRRGEMVYLNLLYLLIWLPAAAWSVINVTQFFAEDLQGMNSLFFTYLLVLFPCIAITGPFTAGISYVMRNWARDEHSFLFSGFIQGMKDNWKQALLFSLINGLAPLTVYLCVQYYMELANASPLFCIPIGIIALTVLIWSLAAQLMPTMMVSYNLSFKALVKNSVLLSLATLPRAIGIKILTLILPIITIVCILLDPMVMQWFGVIIFTAYAFFMLSFNKLLQASYSNFVCEKYLNSQINGAPMNIGLRREE